MAAIVNYDYNTFIVQAEVATTIVNYNCNIFTVQATGLSLI